MNVYTITGDSKTNGHPVNGVSKPEIYPHRDHGLSPGEIRNNQKGHWLWNKDTVKVSGYLAALLSFLLMFNVPGLPKLPYPIAGNLLDWQKGVIPVVWKNGTVLVLLLWGIIYCCKTVLIIMSHNYLMCCMKSRANSNESKILYKEDISLCHLAASLICVHVIFGAWIGWANNIHCGYHTSDTEYLAIGCCVFVAGEITYFITRVLRFSRGDSMYLVVLSEAADLVVFSGFALVSFTMSAFAWVLFRLIMSAMVVGQLLDTGIF